MNKSIFIIIVIITVNTASARVFTNNPQRVPGKYPGFADIYAPGINWDYYDEDKEPDDFDYNFEFFLWFYERMLGFENAFTGVTFGADYGLFFQDRNIWEDAIGKLLLTDSEDASLEESPGIKGSWFLSLRIWKRLWLRPGLKYHYYNAILEIRNFVPLRKNIPDLDNNLTLNTKLQYLEFPLLLRYDFAKDTEVVPYLSFGPQLHVFLSGKVYWDYTAELENGNECFRDTGTLNVSNLDNFGVSIYSSLGITYRQLFLEMRFESCLTKLNNIDRNHYLSDESGKTDTFLMNACKYKQSALSLNLRFHFRET
ncbi:MAG: PorT family protein [Candidatus Cloacimonetes bacterium]|nr:PorT family protein [Candidatus Cloacimonadota bacterium]